MLVCQYIKSRLMWCGWSFPLKLWVWRISLPLIFFIFFGPRFKKKKKKEKDTNKSSKAPKLPRFALIVLIVLIVTLPSWFSTGDPDLEPWWETETKVEDILWNMSKKGQATCPAKLVRQVGQSASLDLQEVLEIFASGQIMQQKQQFQIFKKHQRNISNFDPKSLGWLTSPRKANCLDFMDIHRYPMKPHKTLARSTCTGWCVTVIAANM